ncbi:MAG: hypothetical protein WEF86_05270 [Gemmatimonadota bacterium]
MNRRVLTAALAAMLIFPAAAAAQLSLQDDTGWMSNLRVTPFIGYLTSFERTEEWFHTGGTEADRVRVQTDIAGGTTFGLEGEYPLRGRFGAAAAAAFASRDRSFVVLHTGEMAELDGNNVFLLRAGGVMHLREDDTELVKRRLGASVFAGGVVMHERPHDELGTADLLDSATHFGVNFGVAGELPFGNDRFAVNAAIEDNIMWWSDGPSTNLAASYFDDEPATATIESDLTHAWLVRAGVSIRIR